MPVTIEHEAPLEVLERFPGLLPRLLRDQLGRPVPLEARVRPVSSNFNITVAQELRSDSAVVLETSPDRPPACAAILEPQRRIDPEKWYSWPSYLSELHRKYRCPTYLIVFAIGEEATAVAAWARQPIATFQPGSGFAPLVAQEVSDVVHAVALVATGFGICLVPHSATAMHVPGVTYRPLHHPTQSRVDLCCIYRADDDSQILRALLTSMRQSVTRLDLP